VVLISFAFLQGVGYRVRSLYNATVDWQLDGEEVTVWRGFCSDEVSSPVYASRVQVCQLYTECLDKRRIAILLTLRCTEMRTNLVLLAQKLRLGSLPACSIDNH